MSNKTLAFALLLSMGAFAHAQTSPTFADIANANTALKLQELNNKLHEAKARDASALPANPGIGVDSTPPTLPPPVPGNRTPRPSASAVETVDVEKIQLIAIYGIGEKLNAELQYNGATHTVRASGRNARVGPWTVESISPYHVGLVKPGVSGVGKKAVTTAPVRKEIYLFSEAAPDDASAQNTKSRFPGGAGGMGSPFGGGSTMPPTLPPAGLR